MNQLPSEVIRKIKMFLSHPVADLIRENTRFRSTCSFYDEQEHEEYVIGRHMRNHLGVKRLTSDNIALCDCIYIHINKSIIESLIEEDSYDLYCDCCVELWEDCQCWCNCCWDEYKTCPNACYFD